MKDDSHWLNKERLHGYPRLFVALYILFCIGWAVVAKDGMDPFGKPVGYDFITFWSASRIALEGSPVDAYMPLRLFDVQREALPALKMIFAWHYPPTFYLAILPLSLLPYLWSYGVFVLTTLGAYWLVVRRVAVPGGATVLFFAFPGVFVNALHGQNAFLTGALLGTTLLLLERRPVLAGICAGLLVIKPHLALLLPLAFVCIRAWTALVAAALSAVALLGMSVAVLGVEALTAFFANLHFVRLILEQGVIPWAKMPTFFALASLLGASPAVAYALQALGAVCAVGCIVWVWRQPVDYALKASVLVIGTLLVSPYLFDYDLALLALPLAWFGMYGLRTGWRRGERNLLVLCWVLPALVAPLAGWTYLQLAPFVLLALLLVVIRRVREEISFA